jgi:hypothetical protein
VINPFVDREDVLGFLGVESAVSVSSKSKSTAMMFWGAGMVDPLSY